MISPAQEKLIRKKYRSLAPLMDERLRRQWAAAEARALGHGGVTCLRRITRLSRTTILAGTKKANARPQGRQRLPGGGRKKLVDTQPGIKEALDQLIEPATRGDPCSPLRWTSKSKEKLAKSLKVRYRISASTVGRMLKDMGYSLQSERKSNEGGEHPDRDAQFEHINKQAKQFENRGQPVISVDTKKKELVGEFKNGGREWQEKGKPVKVNVYDFIDDGLGKAIPYGVYDIGRNEGWVNVGCDHDTPAFAVESIRQWWRTMGRKVYPEATELYITADGGGSNGRRARAWKVGLQALADETGLCIQVSHFPPGTSKWNKIEHRMFCHITQNWRGRPLSSYETVVELIGHTTTESGLRIKVGLDKKEYPVGVEITDAQMKGLRWEEAGFHGEWNYTLYPGSLGD